MTINPEVQEWIHSADRDRDSVFICLLSPNGWMLFEIECVNASILIDTQFVLPK